MRTVRVVPGTRLKNMIEGGIDVSEIAAEVKRSAEGQGLRGEIGFLIEIPEIRIPHEEVPTTFSEV